MKKEFALAFNEVIEEKQLPREIIIEALEDAMVSAYRKTVNASTAQHIEAKFDLDTGEVEIFAEKEVAEDIQDERTEVILEIAKKFDPEAEIGSLVIVETTPKDFGRVAAQNARQVIQQRIREAERESQFEHFRGLEGEVVNGIIQAMHAGGITLGLDRKAEGHMPRSQQIRGERFRIHDRVRALLLEVKQSPRGPQIILSRAHRNFLRRLLEDEVPEIYQGLVEIRSISREPGYRSKVAVSALQPGIDPVGACVGIRGVRIQAIVRELNDEKIDVIEWNNDPAAFIAKALSPARVTGVFLTETEDNKTATVVVPEDQLSLAIGRDGQNARLAAKLTSWRIDIKSLPEAAGDVLNKLQNNPEFAAEAEEFTESMPQIEAILAKKAEGRPIPPEEYQLLGRFVNQVEHGAVDRRQAELEARKLKESEERAKLPVTAFDIQLDELGISPRMSINLSGEGYSTIGELMLQLAIDADVILSLNGIGPKAMEEISEALEKFEFPEPEPEPEPEIVEPEPVEVAEGEQPVVAEAEQAESEPTAEADEAQPAAEVKSANKETPATVEPVSIEDAFAAPIAETETSSGEGKQAELEEEEKKKKTKKRKYREVEYDPDRDVTIVKHLRKRDGDDFENFDEFD